MKLGELLNSVNFLKLYVIATGPTLIIIAFSKAKKTMDVWHVAIVSMLFSISSSEKARELTVTTKMPRTSSKSFILRNFVKYWETDWLKDITKSFVMESGTFLITVVKPLSRLNISKLLKKGSKSRYSVGFEMKLTIVSSKTDAKLIANVWEKIRSNSLVSAVKRVTLRSSAEYIEYMTSNVSWTDSVISGSDRILKAG